MAKLTNSGEQSPPERTRSMSSLDTELQKPMTVADLINKRLDLLLRIEKLSKDVSEIDAICKTFAEYSCDEGEFRKQDYEHARCMKTIDVALWNYVVKSAGLTSVMTEKAKDEFLKKIKDNPPPFEKDQIAGFIQNAETLYGESIDQTLREVFKAFTHCRYGRVDNDWQKPKLDNCQKIERQFRISGGIHLGYCGYEVSSYRSNIYDDLLVACCLLDGQPRPSYEKTFKALLHEARKTGDVETPFFKVECFKNGNQKVTWKPEKHHILDMLNRYGSTGELPDIVRKRYKAEHYATAAA